MKAEVDFSALAEPLVGGAVQAVIQMDDDSYLVEYEKNGNKMCSIMNWDDESETLVGVDGWTGWYQDCQYQLVKAFWKDDAKYKRICEECEKFNDGIIDEGELKMRTEMFEDGTLEVSVKHLKGRNKCKDCGKRPEILYWGNGKLMYQCPECKSTIYVGRIKDTDQMLSPIIMDVLKQWNKDNPARRRKNV